MDNTRLPKRRRVADRTCRPATPSTLVSNSIQPESYSTSTTGLWPLFPGPGCASQRAGRAEDSAWGPSTNGRPGAVAGAALPPVSQSEVDEGDEVAERAAPPSANVTARGGTRAQGRRRDRASRSRGAAASRRAVMREEIPLLRP